MLFLDTETFSTVPIEHGTAAYAEHAEVLLIAWAIDDGPVVGVLDIASGEVIPQFLYTRMLSDQVTTHGAFFDRTVLREALGIDIPLPRWHCTMARALAHSLPGGLAQLCDVLGVPVDKAKDKMGRDLLRLFTKPRPKNAKIRRATRHTHPVEWARFVDYARLDVEAMREVDRKLPRWNDGGSERDLWLLDQRINDRGIQVDVELAKAALAAVKVAQARLASETKDATLGLVGNTSQRDVLLAHIFDAYGVDLPDLQKSTLERRANDPDLPQEVRDLIALRLEASGTSTSKYQALLRGVSRDGRLRGTLQFCGASRTGRWSGRIFQPQNLFRPTLPQEEIDAGIDALLSGCADLVYE